MGQSLRVSRPSDYTPTNAGTVVAQQLLMQSAMADPAKLVALQQKALAGVVSETAPVAPVATEILILTNLTSETGSLDLDTVLEDVQEEGEKFGQIVSGIIVKSTSLESFKQYRQETLVGDVYLEFAESAHALQCYKVSISCAVLALR